MFDGSPMRTKTQVDVETHENSARDAGIQARRGAWKIDFAVWSAVHGWVQAARMSGERRCSLLN
jgi:hypothetical protein